MRPRLTRWHTVGLRAAAAVALNVLWLSAYAQSTAAPPSVADAAAQSASTAPVASQPIDLATALRLAGLNDVDLALVRSAQATANAANDAALLQFFPWLSVGGGYDRHSGATTEVGRIVDESSQISNRGAALNEQLSLGDAVFARLAAQQRARAAGYDVQASQNDTALAAAGEYFDLVNAIATADIAAEAVRISQEYADQLDRAYQIGLANHSDLLRVAVQTQRDRVTQRGAEAAVRSASAALATLLRLDPAIPLEPSERIVSPPTLVPIDTPLASLVK